MGKYSYYEFPMEENDYKQNKGKDDMVIDNITVFLFCRKSKCINVKDCQHFCINL